ncbi:Protein kinase, putative [Hondaea fermentalgiana]|uniref:Protein kinase, putative n=1 Tax=Hondaea fermentalgiana TaxID=2315210 RepID=A0A2R5GQ62_9STRA|nr:Protein kinase, putative [Hondaea fermentalgiana]|eukprot:GBG30024.1 Protein kinase, putative [Hondaea fermentalgiana]
MQDYELHYAILVTTLIISALNLMLRVVELVKTRRLCAIYQKRCRNPFKRTLRYHELGLMVSVNIFVNSIAFLVWHSEKIGDHFFKTLFFSLSGFFIWPYLIYVARFFLQNISILLGVRISSRSRVLEIGRFCGRVHVPLGLLFIHVLAPWGLFANRSQIWFLLYAASTASTMCIAGLLVVLLSHGFVDVVTETSNRLNPNEDSIRTKLSRIIANTRLGARALFGFICLNSIFALVLCIWPWASPLVVIQVTTANMGAAVFEGATRIAGRAVVANRSRVHHKKHHAMQTFVSEVVSTNYNTLGDSALAGTTDASVRGESMSAGNKGLVLVSGATGYIGSHVVQAFLLEGYRVRGTVRNLSKASHLQEWIAEGAALELVEADLGNAESWVPACEGCDYVAHVASPFLLACKPAEAEEKLYKPAREGTLNVLRAAKQAGTVKRVVVTSSMAAVAGGHSNEELEDKPESLWTDEDAVQPYAKSKTMAERAAWKFVEDNPGCFELSTICPTLVVGPPLSAAWASSHELIRRLTMREMPGVPNMATSLVDVRDVARAHVLAMSEAGAAGQRYALVNEPMNFLDISKIIAAALNEYGYKPPTRKLPYALLWIISHFDGAVREILPQIGKPAARVNNAKVREELGLSFHDVRDSIEQHAIGCIFYGVEGFRTTEKFAAKFTSMPSPDTARRGAEVLDGRLALANSKKIRKIKDLYEVKDELGKGAFSVVYRGKHLASGETVAIKVIQFSSLSVSEQQRQERILENEIKIMQRIRERCDTTNLIVIKDVVREENRLAIVMEVLEGKELFDRIVARQRYTEQDAAHLMIKIMRAVQTLHKAGILHRDLKPENLVFSSDAEDAEVKITDFGLAMVTEWPDVHKTVVGTPNYVAPEVVSIQPRGPFYGEPCDIWSMGVILYILLVGYPPFYHENVRELFKQIRRGQYEFHAEQWGNISKDAKDLVSRMLVTDPTKRLTCEEVLAHRWMKNAPSAELDSTLDQMKKLRAKQRFRAAAMAVIWGAQLGMRRRLQTLVDSSEANCFNLEELQRIRASFQLHAFEEQLDRASFHSAMRRLGFEDVPFDRMFDLFDINGAGAIDYRTFLVNLAVLRKSEREALELCFNIYDEDGSGHISKQNVGKVLSTLLGAAPETASETLERIFQRVDVNGDELISFEEFQAGIFAEPVLVQAFLQPMDSISSLPEENFAYADVERGIIDERYLR